MFCFFPSEPKHCIYLRLAHKLYYKFRSSTCCNKFSASLMAKISSFVLIRLNVCNAYL